MAQMFTGFFLSNTSTTVIVHDFVTYSVRKIEFLLLTDRNMCSLIVPIQNEMRTQMQSTHYVNKFECTARDQNRLNFF
mgnify:CR=1 FL=1